MRTLFAMVLACMLAAASLAAADAAFPVNLTGTWKLNLSKSKIEGNGPDGMMLTLKDTPSALDIHMIETGQGGERETNVLLSKGKETSYNLGDTAAKTKLSYEGKTLRGESEFNWSDGRTVKRTELMSLSEEGKLLNIFLKFDNGREMTLVFDKQ